MRRIHSLTWGTLAAFVVVAGWVDVCAAADPLTTDEAAAVLLDSANRAFNEQKHDFAVDRFREFLKQFGSHRDAARAEYGIGLALLSPIFYPILAFGDARYQG
jgi:hypothetical protein